MIAPPNLLDRTLNAVRSAGAEAAEAFLETSIITMAWGRSGRTTRMGVERMHGMAVRMVIDGRFEFLTARGRSDEDIEREIEAALAARDLVSGSAKETSDGHRTAEPDDLPAIDPATVPAAEPLKLLDPALGEVDLESLFRIVDVAQSAALRHSPDLEQNYILQREVREVAIASSRGARAEYTAARAVLRGRIDVGDGNDAAPVIRGWFATRVLDELAPGAEALSARLLERVLACRDADPAPGHLPRELTVVLPPDHAARILQGLAGAMSAARVLGERSCLAGQLGKMIGSELLNIIDDGTLPGGLGSAPVDAEGVPSAYHHPVLNGRLTGYLSDTASARRLQIPSTGNAARQDFRHPPAIRPRNFLLCPGHRTPEEIVGAIDRGLLVFEVVSPAARWVDVASGRITLAAYGRLIEHGQLGRMVVVPLAGSLVEVLAGLSAVAHDVTWSGTIASPTIAVDGFRVG